MKKNASNTASRSTALITKAKKLQQKKGSKSSTGMSRDSSHGRKYLSDTTDNRSTSAELSEREIYSLREYQSLLDMEYIIAEQCGELASQRLTG